MANRFREQLRKQLGGLRMGFLSGEGRSRSNGGFVIAVALLGFVFMATGTASAATFKSVNGEVVIEAETYTRLGGTIGGTWFINKKLSGYDGTGYIEATTDGPGSGTYNPKIIRAEYDINFQETGRYYLHLRTFAYDHLQNGFFATLDGREIDYGHKYNTYIHAAKKSKWWWRTKGGMPHGGIVPPGEYKVSINVTNKGVQKLAFYRRDAEIGKVGRGPRIDKIWLTKKQSAIQDTGTLNLTDPAVFIDDGKSPPPTPTPTPPPSTPGDEIRLEAEEFDANVERGDHGWVAASQGGVSAMESVPDLGISIKAEYVQNSPHLSFDVNFTKTGKYYIWLRGFCEGRDNSVHVGLNGRAVRTAKNIALPINKGWVWSGTRANGNRATITVKKTGSQTIEVYMREDGLILDQIVLTKSEDYTP